MMWGDVKIIHAGVVCTAQYTSHSYLPMIKV